MGGQIPDPTIWIVCRRDILKLGIGGLCLGVVSPAIVTGQGGPGAAPPQAGDLLVRDGDAELKPLSAADVPQTGPLISAWPMEPSGRAVRNANRLNQIILIKVDPASLTSEVLASSVEGVLAYSGLCPHAGCNVNDWIPATGTLACDCHASEFDSRARGKVVAGPAARALPLLPLKSDNGTLVVAAPFSATIRFDE